MNKQRFVFVCLGAVAQMVALLLNFAYAKLFAPDSIGVYALFLSVIGMLQSVAAFKYDGAIMMEKTHTGQATLFTISLYISIITTIAVAAAYFCISAAKIMSLSAWLLGGILFSPLLVFQQNIYWMMLKNNKLIKISVNKLLCALLVGAAIIFFRLIESSNPLLEGWLCGSLLSVTLTATMAEARERRVIWKPSFLKVNYVLRKYKAFPLFELPMTLFDSGKHVALNITLTYFFGQAANGIYFLASKFVQAPVLFLSNYNGQIFYREVAALANFRKSNRQYVNRTLIWSTLAGIVIYLLISTIGVLVLARILGEKWNGVTVAIQIMSPWFAIYFVGSNISTLAIAAGKQKQFAMLSLVSSIVMVAPIFLAGLAGMKFFDGLIIQAACSFTILCIMVRWLHNHCTT